jgi:hypothetical protein
MTGMIGTVHAPGHDLRIRPGQGSAPGGSASTVAVVTSTHPQPQLSGPCHVATLIRVQSALGAVLAEAAQLRAGTPAADTESPPAADVRSDNDQARTDTVDIALAAITTSTLRALASVLDTDQVAELDRLGLGQDVLDSPRVSAASLSAWLQASIIPASVELAASLALNSPRSMAATTAATVEAPLPRLGEGVGFYL